MTARHFFAAAAFVLALSGLAQAQTPSAPATGGGSSGSLALTSGHIFVGNASNVATDVAASGDLTLANTGAFTVTKTNGVAFGTMATQNANAVAITGGTITGTTVGGNTITAGTGTLTLGSATITAGSSGTLAILGANTFTGVQTFPNGTVSAPSINLGDAATGWYRNANSQWTFASGSANVLSLINTSSIRSSSSVAIVWSSGDSTTSADTGFSRLSPGLIGAGTGTQGSTAGSMSLLGITLGGQITAQSMTQTSGAQSGTLCQNIAATVTYDATLGCLTSDERLKTNIAPLSGAIPTLMALQPMTYDWSPQAPRFGTDPGNHIGMGAFATAYADERLIARGEDGQPRGWRTDAMISLTVAVTQDHERRLLALEARH